MSENMKFLQLGLQCFLRQSLELHGKNSDLCWNLQMSIYRIVKLPMRIIFFSFCIVFCTISPLTAGEGLKQIQEGLNWFGYNAGTPDGVSGKKTRAAIKELQKCWELVDPSATIVPTGDTYGKFTEVELAFFLKHYYETATMRPRIYFDDYRQFGQSHAFTACDYFRDIVFEVTNLSTDEPYPGQCFAEGDPSEPVFYCSFGGGEKEISICDELDEDARSEEDRNSLSYNFGKVSKDIDMYILDRLENVFSPNENYTADDIPLETSNKFEFKNDSTSYVLDTETWMHSKGRRFNASLSVIQGNKVLATLECDEGSIIDNTWNGILQERLKGLPAANMCIQKSKGYGLINTPLMVEDKANRIEDDLISKMMSIGFGTLDVEVGGSEAISLSLRGFEESFKLTKLNSDSLADGMTPIEGCFGEWCSVCNEIWPGDDPNSPSCFIIHDVNSSGLMPSFDLHGRASLHEECYPKLSYPCIFAGQPGSKISIDLSIKQQKALGGEIFTTGPVDWQLFCEE